MNNRFFFCAVFSIVFFLSACKSSTSPNGGGGGNQVVMTALVNGNAWYGIIPFTGHNNGYLDFSAADSSHGSAISSSVIEILYIQTDTGTYPINGNTGDSCFATYSRDTVFYVSNTNSGKIHFSTLTANHATGTFNFIATNINNPKDSVKITNGTFDIAR